LQRLKIAEKHSKLRTHGSISLKLDRITGYFSICPQEHGMYFLGLGLILLVLKGLEIGPVGQWDWGDKWYLFAGPFILAAAWWAYADWSGYSKRREMDKMAQRKQDRLAKNRDAMGMPNSRKR
jgi:small Trp-rich protein